MPEYGTNQTQTSSLLLDGHPGGTVSALMDAFVYVSVGVGYLVTLLTTSPLRTPGFLLLTIASAAWIALYYRISAVACTERQQMIALLGMVGVTFVGLGASWLGSGFDWLLPVIMVGVIASVFQLRPALLLTGLILLGSVLVLFLASGLPSGESLISSLTLIPAFTFAFLFPLLLRKQQEQRARAESLVVELQAAQEQLRVYASEVEELAITRERNRMAREIHDTLGHYLTILAVQLETALKLEERGDPCLRDEITEARRVTAECLAEVRRSVGALRPADPTARSFADALARLVGEFEAAQPETEIALDIEGPAQTLSPELRIALYRCAQEALTNIRKHAHATKVLLRLRVEDARAELSVLDNGTGAASGADGHTPGFGLLGIRERIELLGGSARASAEPGRGWRVEVTVPVATSACSPPAPATPN